MPPRVRKRQRPHRYAGMSLAERTAARRDDFIAAGVDVIDTVGIRNVKVRDVCHRADLTERFFYENFPNLEGFAKAVIEALAIKTAMRVMTRVLAEPDVTARPRALISEVVTVFDEDPRIGRILLIETVRAGGALAELRGALLVGGANVLRIWLGGDEGPDVLQMVAPLTDQFRRGEEVGGELIASRDPGAVAMAGAMAELFAEWLHGRIEMSSDELVEYLIELFGQTMGSAPHARSE